MSVRNLYFVYNFPGFRHHEFWNYCQYQLTNCSLQSPMIWCILLRLTLSVLFCIGLNTVEKISYQSRLSYTFTCRLIYDHEGIITRYNALFRFFNEIFRKVAMLGIIDKLTALGKWHCLPQWWCPHLRLEVSLVFQATSLSFGQSFYHVNALYISNCCVII